MFPEAVVAYAQPHIRDISAVIGLYESAVFALGLFVGGEFIPKNSMIRVAVFQEKRPQIAADLRAGRSVGETFEERFALFFAPAENFLTVSKIAEGTYFVFRPAVSL